MKYFGTSVVLVCGLVMSGTAWAQPKSLKDQVLGSWNVVSISEDYGGGKVNQYPFGQNLKGAYDFDPNGRVMFMAIGDDLPPDPARKPQVSARMAVAWFGTYTVNDAANTVTFTAERATIPAFDGHPRTASVTVNGDQMIVKSSPVKGPQGTFIPTLVCNRVGGSPS